jgi:conjugal transfer pilus assembly protein TraV
MNKCMMTTFGLSLFCLVGCAPVNTTFSCNATAGDRCLSIEEVDAMTQSGSTTVSHKRSNPYQWNPAEMKAENRHSQPQIATKTQTIWIAPWTDEMGQLHQNDTLFASASHVRTVS